METRDAAWEPTTRNMATAWAIGQWRIQGEGTVQHSQYLLRRRYLPYPPGGQDLRRRVDCTSALLGTASPIRKYDKLLLHHGQSLLLAVRRTSGTAARCVRCWRVLLLEAPRLLPSYPQRCPSPPRTRPPEGSQDRPPNLQPRLGPPSHHAHAHALSVSRAPVTNPPLPASQPAAIPIPSLAPPTAPLQRQSPSFCTRELSKIAACYVMLCSSSLGSLPAGHLASYAIFLAAESPGERGNDR